MTQHVPVRAKPRDQRAWRLVPSRIREAAQAVVQGQEPETVAKRFSKYVSPKDLVVWAHDFERLNEADFQAKYGTPRRKPRSSPPSSGLSLKNTAVAARNEEQRLMTLERQLTEQLTAVRAEKKDVEDLLGFLERKAPRTEAPHGS